MNLDPNKARLKRTLCSNLKVVFAFKRIVCYPSRSILTIKFPRDLATWYPCCVMVAQVLFTELAHQSGSDVGEDALKCEDTWSEGDGKRYGMRMCSGSGV